MNDSILIFGSFDGLHPGHINLIDNSTKHATRVIVALAQDKSIQKHKGKMPLFPLAKRVLALKQQFPNITIEEGDQTQGEWSAIKKYNPKYIAVGYDQHKLRKALVHIQEQYNFSIIDMNPYHPEKYKSSIINRNNR